jgi:hypothetical protein
MALEHRRWGRRVARMLAVLVAALALAGQTGWPRPAVVAHAATDAPLDLAAAALTPSDLAQAGFLGYRFADGDTRSPADTAAAFAFQYDLPEDAVHAAFAGEGLRQSYELVLTLGAENAEAAGSVASTIHEYADEDGAAAAFAFWSATIARAANTDAVANEPVGDESFAARWRGATAASFRALDLTFRAGRLLVSIRLASLPGGESAIGVAETLAVRLLERIEARQAAPAGGLSARTLRLSGPGAVDHWDYYTRVDGEGPADLLDEKTVIEGLVEDFGVSQRLRTSWATAEDTYFYAFVQRYSDEETAAARFAGAWARQEADERFEDLAELPDWDGYGDESIAYTQTFAWAPHGADLIYQSAQIRVGDQLALVQLIAPVAWPTEALAALAAAQTACLEVERCPVATPLPAPLRAAAKTLAIGVFPGPLVPAADDAPRPETVPIGDEFDAEVTYDPTAWSPIAVDEVNGADDVMFYDAGSNSVLGMTVSVADGDAEACLAALTAHLAVQEARGVVRPLTDGPGRRVAAADDAQAHAAFATALEDGRRTYLYLECRSFADGEAALIVTHVGPLTGYDEGAAARADLVAGLNLPNG